MKEWIYKHYKWNLYEVLWIWKNTETLEDFVIYVPLYESEKFPDLKFWIRPKNLFLWKVNIEWKVVERFEYIWSKKYESI